MIRRRVLWVVLALAAAGAFAAAREPQSAALLAAKERLADRDWATAIRALSEVAAAEKGTPAGMEASYLIVKASVSAEQFTPALDAAARFLDQYPEAAYASKVRFLMADAYAGMRRWADAAEVYRERSEFLTGDAYRLKLAKLYLEIADEGFDGMKSGREGDPLDPPKVTKDYGRAVTYYQKAREIGLDEALRAKVTHRIATSFLELRNPAAAAAEWAKLLEKPPQAEIASEAAFGLGKAYVALGKPREAREMFSRVEQQHADHPLAPLAVEQLGWTFPLGDKEGLKRRLGHWRRFLERYPQHEGAPRVALAIAQSLEQSGDLEAAVLAYQEIVAKFPKDPLAPEAAFAIGTALLRREEFDRAREGWTRFLSQFPTHARFVEAQRAIVQALYLKGDAHFKAKRWEAAEAAWREFLVQYPVDALSAPAQNRIASSLYERAQWKKALDEYAVTASKYRQTAEAPAAQLRVAQIRERDEGNLPEAIRQYEALIRDFPGSNEAAQAREVVRVMREKELKITSARAFASNEPVELAIESRNIPKLKMKAYKLDLLEYFKRKHAIGGVEQLAVEIVAPDKSWTDEIEAHEAYRLYARQVKLPLDEKGAYVIACEEDALRAVALAIRSDISIIAKQGPQSLLVFARDEVSGAPAPGVKVLVSDGGSIVAEGETGKDGVFQHGYGRSMGQVRVFAHRGKDVASTDLTPAAETTWGYTTKAYVYTDRPVYRPGQKVYWRGIVRRVESGLYQPSSGVPVRVRVRDARGVALIESEVRTNAFGSFSGDVTLGEEPPLGRYAVEAEVDGTGFAGGFEVESYKKPEALVDVEPGRRDILTGEEVTATARVRYYFGGPVREAPVRWAVYQRPYAFDSERYRKFSWFFAKDAPRGDGGPGRLLQRGEGKSDVEGRVSISFEAEPGDDDRLYTIEVEAQDPSRRWISGAANVFVTARAFYAVVQVDKKVYRPGEGVRASIIAVDAAHRGVAAKGELVVYRRLPQGGEDPVSKTPVATGADGRASAEVKAPRPGDYRLVFTAEDRRGGVIEGGASLVVAGEAEDLAKEAKIIAEREVYNRGEKAQVLVNSPVAPAWALVTFEGERVLDYRVVRLESRSTTIVVDMTDAYSPNVFLRVAIAAEKKLFEAEDEVAVLKFLKLSVAPDRPTAKPGEKVKWIVEATDHAGKPAEAEVSLAVVDAAIYAIKRDETPEIQPFFYDQKRTRAVATRSSLDWRYDGVTARQAAELLAELERRAEEARAEAEGRELGERTREAREALRRAMPRKSKNGALREEADASAESAAEPAGAPMPAPGEAATAAPGGPMLGMEKANDIGVGGGFGGRAAGKKMAAAARVRKSFADTAYWNPAVVTGADGRGAVEVTLPDNLTTWRATVRGATRDTLVGSAEAEVTATQKVLVRLEMPRFATQGDRFSLSTLAHNYTGAPLAMEHGLKAEGPLALAAAERSAATVAPGDVSRMDHGAAAKGHGSALLKAQALSPVESDALEQRLEVAPWGVRERQATSGALPGGEAFWRFEIAEGSVEGTERLTLHLTPSISTAALDALVYLEEFPYGCIEQSVHRFLPAVGMKRALERLGIASEGWRRRLDESVRRGITRLANAQNQDGGWGWWPAQRSSPPITALALLGLELARESGAFVDGGVLERGRQGAANLLRACGDDHASRAALLRALALSRRAPDDELGRAMRAVDELPTRAAADLVLACADQGRPEMAARALARVRQNAEAGWKEAEVWRHAGGFDGGGFYGGVDEAAAATILALLKFDAQSALVEKAVEFLLGRRQGVFWRSTRETGTVVLALGSYLEARGVAESEYTVKVFLDGKEYASTQVLGGTADRQKRTLVIERPDLVPGKHELRLSKEGSGTLRFSAVAESVRAVEKIGAAGNLVAVSRKYVRWIAPQAERDAKGRPTAPGYSILEPAARPSWRDEEPLAEVASGERVNVRVAVTLREPIAYAIIEDRLPAGLEALVDGSSGPLERFEPRDDRVAFFASRLAAGTHVFSYVARAVTPGEFAALPAEGYPMYEPEVYGRSEGARLVVKAEALVPREPTPDELYAQALELAERGELEKARAIVEKLLAMKLLAEPRERLLVVLLDARLAAGDHRGAVGAFEELNDKNPRLGAERARDRKTARALAAAYRAIGDAQRALALLRGLVEQQFRLDAEVAGVYASLQREIGAQDYMVELVRRYPDADYVTDGWFRVARRYYDLDKKDRSGRPKKMLEEAYHALKEFIAFNPRSVHCDDALFTAARAMLALGQAEIAALEWERLPARHPKSELVDDALMSAMQARFDERKWDQALALGEKVLAFRVKRGDHVEGSPFVPQARHLFAKIYHLKGDIERAVAFYALVAGQFDDARDTLALFTANEVSIPEVVAVEPGKVALPVKFKNLGTLELKLYPVDLLLLFAKQVASGGGAALADVSRVDLSGIVPRHELKAPLQGKRYEWNETGVVLPIGEKGVYLAVAKADALDASALVILSEVAIDVQRVDDRARVYARTRKDGKPAADTYVTVASGGRILGRGRTDARGVFEARGASGPVSAVAEREGHFALWREGE